jgi:hypothetical protein
MVQINRSQIVESANTLLRLDPLIDGSLNRSEDKIQPVVLVSDLGTQKVVTATRNVTAIATVHTCSTSKDTYLNSAFLTSQSNVTADNVLTTLTITPKGSAAVVLLRLDKITLTVHSGNIAIDFNKPILLEKGSLITHISTFTVGACTYSSTVVLTEIEA